MGFLALGRSFLVSLAAYNFFGEGEDTNGRGVVAAIISFGVVLYLTVMAGWIEVHSRSVLPIPPIWSIMASVRRLDSAKPKFKTALT